MYFSRKYSIYRLYIYIDLYWFAIEHFRIFLYFSPEYNLIHLIHFCNSVLQARPEDFRQGRVKFQKWTFRFWVFNSSPPPGPLLIWVKPALLCMLLIKILNVSIFKWVITYATPRGELLHLYPHPTLPIYAHVKKRLYIFSSTTLGYTNNV